MSPRGKKPARKPRGKGRPKAHADALHRTFGDLEVRDAVADLRVPIRQEAFDRSVKLDPENCMVAESCKQVLGSSAAVIFKCRAYVDVVGEDGVRRVERFVVTKKMRGMIEAFDRGEAVNIDDSWLVLKKPTEGQSLERAREKNLTRGRSLTGTYTPSGEGTPRAGTASDRGEPRDVEVRSGTGRWQMNAGRGQVAA